MLANGVTPMPVPIRMATSLLKTSSAGAPNGPSTRMTGSERAALVTSMNDGPPSSVFSLTVPSRAASVSSCASARVQPSRSPSAIVQSPAWRMCTDTNGSSGAEEMVNGCHCQAETSGTLRNSHMPGRYLNDGLRKRSSIAPDGCISTPTSCVCRRDRMTRTMRSRK